MSIESWDGLGLSPKLIEIVAPKFIEPTVIQGKSIPVAVEGKDIIGIAQTGTGKTLAFGLPLIQRVARVKGKGLVIAPTRELAEQAERMLLTVGKPLGLRTAVLIGGLSIGPQKEALARKPHIVIGTPGRIIDHLEQGTLDLSDCTALVLDEADRMLDMGFMPQIRRIVRVVPKERQTMLFSATMPEDIAKLAEQYMRDPVRVEAAPAGTPAELVQHQLYVIDRDKKNRLMEKLLSEFDGTVLVFTRTKEGARRVARAARGMGHDATEIHSDRTQAQRKEALHGFKSGRFRVLVATDIAARGIDVSGIGMVLNYDIPENSDDYVHRIGRTGRAGQSGLAVAFATPEQKDEVLAIERSAGVYLPISPLPELPPDRIATRMKAEADEIIRRHSRRIPAGVVTAASGDFTFFEGQPDSDRRRRPSRGRRR
jgi:ATP-dependent RNA helicase RhlE